MNSIYIRYALPIFLTFVVVDGAYAVDTNTLRQEFCEYNYMTPLYREFEGNKYDEFCKVIFRKIDMQKSRTLKISYKSFVSNF